MNADIIVPIIVALLGGGFLGGLALILKVRTDSGLVTVTAAEKVVVIQADKIEDLDSEIRSIRAESANAVVEAARCSRQVKSLKFEVEELRYELVKTRQQRDQFASENTELKYQVTALASRVKELERRNEWHEEAT